jgi:hypothetical protein
MSVADDFGLFDGRAAVIRASAFPLRFDTYTLELIERCLEEMAGAGLIHRYEVDSKPYLEILKFNQRTRAAVSKFPAPDRRMTVICQSDDRQLTDTRQSSAHGDGDGDEDGDGSPSSVRQFLERYPRKTSLDLAAQTWLSLIRPEEEGGVLEGLERWLISEQWASEGGKFVPSPVKFLQERRWLDFPAAAKRNLDETPIFNEDDYA